MSSVLVRGLTDGSFAYNYRIDGKILQDIYTRQLYGREKFGQKMPETPDGIASDGTGSSGDEDAAAEASLRGDGAV